MSTLEIGSITLQLHRKAIKNLHISVLPPDGRVRVSAPEKMTDTAIRMAVISRLAWIKKQQHEFACQPRQSCREMVSGESHFFWGQRYRLNLIERQGKHEIKISPKKLNLYVAPGTRTDNKAEVLNTFYRKALKVRVNGLLADWKATIGVTVNDWGIKKMKTKWGSCNTEAKRIWLNLELAKKPPECLEYIVVHELIHLLERQHNERFRAYMDHFLPDWRERRALLSSMPLAHNDWVY